VPGVIFFSIGVPVFSAWFLWVNKSRLRQK
jgi:hypothetical protein